MKKDNSPSKTLIFIYSLLVVFSPLGLSDAMSQGIPIPVLTVTASSDGTVSPETWPHNPDMTVDGNIYTAWASSANDTIGSWLLYSFKEPVSLSSIIIINGWVPEGFPNFFSQNYRAKKITLVSDDGSMTSFELKDTNKIQRISLQTKTKTIKISIDDIYPAELSENPWVTISEVLFYE